MTGPRLTFPTSLVELGGAYCWRPDPFPGARRKHALQPAGRLIQPPFDADWSARCRDFNRSDVMGVLGEPHFVVGHETREPQERELIWTFTHESGATVQVQFCDWCDDLCLFTEGAPMWAVAAMTEAGLSVHFWDIARTDLECYSARCIITHDWKLEVEDGGQWIFDSRPRAMKTIRERRLSGLLLPGPRAREDLLDRGALRENLNAEQRARHLMLRTEFYELTNGLPCANDGEWHLFSQPDEGETQLVQCFVHDASAYAALTSVVSDESGWPFWLERHQQGKVTECLRFDGQMEVNLGGGLIRTNVPVGLGRHTRDLIRSRNEDATNPAAS